MNIRTFIYSALTLVISFTPLWATPTNTTVEKLWRGAELGNTEAQRRLGQYYIRHQAYPQALAQFEKLLLSQPFDSEFVFAITRCLHGMRQLEKGLKHYLAQKHITPSWKALILQLYLVTGKKKEAAQLAQKIVKEEISPDLLAFVASASKQCMTPKEARPVLEQLVSVELAKKAPNYAPFITLAKLLNESGSQAEVSPVLVAYLNKFTLLHDFEYPATDQLFDSGYIKIIKFLGKMKRDETGPHPLGCGDHPEECMRRALYHYYRGENVIAKQELSKAAKGLVGLGPFSHLTLATIDEKLGFLELCTMELRSALSKPMKVLDLARLDAVRPGPLAVAEKAARFRGELYSHLAKVCRANAKDSAAIDAARRAVLENPEQKLALAILESYATSEVLSRKANRALREATCLCNTPALQAHLALSEGILGNGGAQLEYAQAALLRAPLSRKALEAFVAASIASGNCESAIKACLTFIKNGGSTVGWHLLTDTAIATGLTRPVRACLAECLFVASPIEREGLLCYQALCHDDNSRKTLARECIAALKMAQGAEQKALLRLVLAETFWWLNDELLANKAAENLEKLVGPISPIYERTKNMLVRLGKAREYSEALSQRGLKIIGPAALLYHREAARLCEIAGDRCKAMVHYARALEYGPGQRDLEEEFYQFGCRTSGYPYFMQGLLEKTSGHFAFYRFLGSYFLRKGHDSNALSFLRLAYGERPEASDVSQLYGRALLFGGQNDRGKELVLRGLSIKDWPLTNEALALERHALVTKDRNTLAQLTTSWLEATREKTLRRYAIDRAILGGLKEELCMAALVAEKKGPLEPAMTLQRATVLELTDQRSKILPLLEEGLRRCVDVGARFTPKSETSRLLKKYVDAALECREGVKALALLEKLVEDEPYSLVVRKAYEQLLRSNNEKARAHSSIENSISLFAFDSQERLSRIREFILSLKADDKLEEYCEHLRVASTSSLTPEQHREHLYSLWLSNTLLEREEETQEAKTMLQSRAKALGRRGIELLKELGCWQTLVDLLGELEKREGEPSIARLRLLKGRVLTEHLGQTKDALVTYEEIIKHWPTTKWAHEARLASLELYLDGAISDKEITRITKELALNFHSKSIIERCLIGRALLKLKEWAKAESLIYSLGQDTLLFTADEKEELLTLVKEASQTQGPKRTVWWKTIALLALQVKHTLLAHEERLDRSFTNVIETLELSHRKRLTKIIGKNNPAHYGLNIYDKALDELAEGNLITGLHTLSRVIKVRPQASDLYGNGLTQAARYEACKALTSLGCRKTLLELRADMMNDANKNGPDYAGSVLRRVDELLLDMNYRRPKGGKAELDLLASAIFDDDPKELLAAVNRITAPKSNLALTTKELIDLGRLLAMGRPSKAAAELYLKAGKETKGREGLELLLQAASWYLLPSSPCRSLKKGRAILEEIGPRVKDEKKLARDYLGLRGEYCRSLGKHERALTYFKKANRPYEEGVCYQYLKKWSKALHCFDRYANKRSNLAKVEEKRFRRTITAFLDEGGVDIPLKSKYLKEILAQEQAMRQF